MHTKRYRTLKFVLKYVQKVKWTKKKGIEGVVFIIVHFGFVQRTKIIFN